MKFLIVNTESFSPHEVNGVKVKRKKELTFTDLPRVVQKFLSVFESPFIVLDECSRIKTNVPMVEAKKSTRTRLIKLLCNFGHRMIMTATLMSKSPLNIIDPYNFLRSGYIPDNMWDFAEQYCIMMTLRSARGRRVLINQKDYEAVRAYLIRAYRQGKEIQLDAAKMTMFRTYGISHANLEHIIQHKKYTPFTNVDALMRRIAPDTLFIKREDVFDVGFDKFVKEPIMRPIALSGTAKRIANELVEVGFTNNMVLGKAPALELLWRLQDVCNGFEPIKDESGAISYKPFKENVKIDALLSLLDEIDITTNQVVVWSSRKLMLRACADAVEKAGITYVVYDGDVDDKKKSEAEEKFKNGEAQVFIANQASGAYGLNCLAKCSYAIYLCVDASVETYYQSQHRILRGQLTAPKFTYGIYIEGSIEERQWNSLRVGQALLSADNRKEIFMFS